MHTENDELRKRGRPFRDWLRKRLACCIFIFALLCMVLLPASSLPAQADGFQYELTFADRQVCYDRWCSSRIIDLARRRLPYVLWGGQLLLDTNQGVLFFPKTASQKPFPFLVPFIVFRLPLAESANPLVSGVIEADGQGLEMAFSRDGKEWAVAGEIEGATTFPVPEEALGYPHLLVRIIGVGRLVRLEAECAATVPGDVNWDGRCDAADVQMVIASVLGLSENTKSDANFDRTVNALDVQLAVNAALGLPIQTTTWLEEMLYISFSSWLPEELAAQVGVSGELAAPVGPGE